MNIFQQIKSSVYNPSYYKDILENKSLGSSFKYFFKYVFILSLLSSIALSAYSVPKFLKFFDSSVGYVSSAYPDSLVVTIDKGKVSTNSDKPVFFPAPGTGMSNLLVIDTVTPFSVAMFNSYKTAALLTSDSVVTASSNGQLRIQPMSSLYNKTITKSTITSFVEKVKTYRSIISPILVFLILILMYIVYSSNIVSVLIFALFVWILLRLIKSTLGVEIGYKKAYQIGLHAVTLSMFYEAISSIPGTRLSVPFLYTAIGLLVVLFNFKSIKNNYTTDIPEAKLGN